MHDPLRSEGFALSDMAQVAGEREVELRDGLKAPLNVSCVSWNGDGDGHGLLPGLEYGLDSALDPALE
jgi:hypothetical protein